MVWREAKIKGKKKSIKAATFNNKKWKQISFEAAWPLPQCNGQHRQPTRVLFCVFRAISIILNCILNENIFEQQHGKCAHCGSENLCLTPSVHLEIRLENCFLIISRIFLVATGRGFNLSWGRR